MRSQKPKGLHEVCGRPMVLWPVLAALEAGAGRVVVVDSPEQALADVLPEGVELAVQPESNGTGGAAVAAMAKLDAEAPPASGPSATIVVLSGDVPLVSAEVIKALVRAHLEGGANAGSDSPDHVRPLRAGRGRSHRPVRRPRGVVPIRGQRL